MERTLIAFNVPNTITILLMVSLGYFVIALVSQFVQRATGAGGGTAPPVMGGAAAY